MIGTGEKRTICAERLGVLGLRHRDADDLAAGARERGDLLDRRGDVVRLRRRHRLHDDGCAAADRDAAYVDRALARHGLRLATWPPNRSFRRPKYMRTAKSVSPTTL